MVVASIMGSELLRLFLLLRSGVARVMMYELGMVLEAGLVVLRCENSRYGS